MLPSSSSSSSSDDEQVSPLKKALSLFDERLEYGDAPQDPIGLVGVEPNNMDFDQPLPLHHGNDGQTNNGALSFDGFSLSDLEPRPIEEMIRR